MDTLCKYHDKDRVLEIGALEESWPVAAVPDLVPGSAPGPADVKVGPIALSVDTVVPGAPLTLSAQVGGKDVAFVYLELLLRDPAREQYYGPVYREAVAAPATKTVGGVVYPDWSAAPMAQVTFEPVLRLLTDGRDWAIGFLKPVVLRGGVSERLYTLEALHQTGWSGKPHRTQLEFDDAGRVAQALAFRELGVGAAPRPFIPRRGDRFIPLLRLFRPAGAGGDPGEKAIVRGDTLKWRAEELQWRPTSLIPGTYLVGLVAEDLDGQLHRRYAPLTVSAP